MSQVIRPGHRLPAALLAAIVAGLGNRMLGNLAAKLVTTGALFAVMCLSWPIFLGFLAGSEARSSIRSSAGSPRATLQVDWALRVDALTAVMLVVVTTVSALVHLYSWGYMAEDDSQPRFFAYLVAVHLRDADAGDRRQSRPDVLRLGRRRPRLLPADRLLVPQALGQRRRAEGVHRQPGRRFRLLARHLRHLPRLRHGLDPRHPRRRAGHGRLDDRLPRGCASTR